MGSMTDDWDRTIGVSLSPTPARLKRPVASARLGLRAARPATVLARRFDGTAGRALLAGNAAHTGARLDRWFTGGVGLLLMAAGHAVGWPMARGGSGSIAASLASVLGSLGARIETGRWVTSLDDLPPARAILFDTTPEALARIAGGRVPVSARRLLERHRRGPGVFKVDWALTDPIPWTDPACGESGTVHLGGTMEEIAAAEAEVLAGGHPEQPFVILAQQSLFDPGRAPARRHTAWAYCHVPTGSTVDQTAAIERQVERFAPGFREAIAARHVMGPAHLEARNPNLAGGDIAGGRFTAQQLLFGPVLRPDPYRVPGTDFYICSASTPPGPGVHGRCGLHAARSALRHSLG
jgi:phytoene dehydrogenase-like protein